MLSSPNGLHVAVAGPAVPSQIKPPESPPERQQPRRFCVLVLRGCQTRWFNDERERSVACGKLRAKMLSYLSLEFDPVIGEYNVTGTHLEERA